MSRRHLVRCAVAAVLVGAVACGSPAPPARTPSPTATQSATPTRSTPGGTSPTPVPTSSPSRTPSTPPTTPRPTTPPPTPSACRLTAQYRGLDLEAVPTSSKVAVLTFDGGASDTGVASVLSTLSRTGAAGTFFLTGDFVRRYPGAAGSISRAHPVGNHSDTHPDLTTLPSSAVVDEVRDGAAAIRAATGSRPGPWFRFPYGARDARTIALVNEQCYVAVRWTVDSLGWKGTSGGMSVASVRDRVLAAARPGMIVLLHVGANPTDGTTLDAAALPAIIEGLRARGYRFLTLEQAL